MQSLPTRERGLKSVPDAVYRFVWDVAPYAGAWIEILNISLIQQTSEVAPYAGAWIEIVSDNSVDYDIDCRSLRGSVD